MVRNTPLLRMIHHTMRYTSHITQIVCAYKGACFSPQQFLSTKTVLTEQLSCLSTGGIFSTLHFPEKSQIMPVSYSDNISLWSF